MGVSRFMLRDDEVFHRFRSTSDEELAKAIDRVVNRWLDIQPANAADPRRRAASVLSDAATVNETLASLDRSAVP
jgi:hypothetical protein